MEGLADRSNKQEVLTTANNSLSWWGCCCCCSYNCNFLRLSFLLLLFLLLPFLLLFLFSLSPLPIRKYKTRSDTRPISIRLGLGRGAIWWAGAEWGRVRLLCGRLRNHQFSQFCVIKILALPYFQHTYLRTQPLIESLSQWLKIGNWKLLWTDGLTDQDGKVWIACSWFNKAKIWQISASHWINN